MRGAVVSGTFYEKDLDSLKRQIESCFKNELGAGMSSFNQNEIKKIQKIISVIAPHAGYAFSGDCASYAYAELMKLQKKDTTFIILGTNHTGQATSDFSVSFEDFKTPLGVVSNNIKFSQKLVAQEKSLKNDENAHENEHSIEVQLPFLQYIFEQTKRMWKIKAQKSKINSTYPFDFRIVPIVCSTQDYEKLVKFSHSLSKLIKKQENENPNLQFVMIASSDFTHYGPNYGFVPFPFDKQTKGNLYKLDQEIIQPILDLNSKAFFEKASKSTVCGLSPITIAIEVSKSLGAVSSKLLKYYTSSDILKDYENSVGYASIVIERS